MTPRRAKARWLPYALLVGVAAAVTFPLFRAAGMPYNVDISGFFPLSTEAYYARFWPLWNEHGGMGTAQFLPALLVELPFLAVGHVLGWGMDVHVKVRILFGFALAGCAMYALARYHVEKYAPNLGPWTRVAIPLVPALFYMLEPWSVHRVFHYFLWLGYGFAPLVLLAFLRLADAPSWRRGAVLGLVAALGSTDPHNPPLFAIVVAPFALFRLVQALRASRGDGARLGRGVLFAALAYVAVCAFWILPYAYSAATDPGFGPTYVLSDEMGGVLSQHATFGEVVRLVHNYQPRAPLFPASGAALVEWSAASLVVPALALAALLLVRRAEVWAYGALGALAITLGMGTNAGGLYHWVIFEGPWGESLSWLFRDPYRWGGIQALAYSALLAFALAKSVLLSRRLPGLVRSSAGIATPSLALAATVLFVAPAVSGYVGSVYDPVEIPSEYEEANAFLATTPEDEGVVWMPRMLGATTWSGDRTFAYFDATSSARPAMGPFRPHTSVYFRFIEDARKDGADVPALLSRIGAERVVFHNDRDPERDATTIEELIESGLVRETRVGDTPVRAVDVSAAALANAPAAKYALHGAREASQTFVPTLADPAVLRIRATSEPGAPLLELRILDDAGGLVASRQLPANDEGGTLAIPIRGVRLVPGETYDLRLRAADAGGNATARWDVSYFKLDLLSPGAFHVSADGATWKTLEGDMAFELQSVAEGFIDVLRSPDPAPRVRGSTTPIASPGSLEMLRVLSAWPEGSSMREAPVVFSAANERARTALATSEGFHWVSPLDASPWEPIVPFLPASSFVAPFKATTSADGKLGWARGTEDFTYYEWGWPSSVAALKQESWDFDNDRGLVYTSARANLSVNVAPSETGATLLARVYEHPRGGTLRLHGETPEGEALVGALQTKAPGTAFRWREVGHVPAGATSVRLESDGAFLAVNLLALVPDDVLVAARSESAYRFQETPVTLAAQAEAVPGLASRILAYPGVGRFAEIGSAANVTFSAPRVGDHALLLRIAQGTPPPVAILDGSPMPTATCVADCDGPAPWFAAPFGEIAHGPHTLTLGPGGEGERPTIDVLAISTLPEGIFAAKVDPVRSVERVDATHYRVLIDVEGPIVVALANPYDAGWEARTADGTIVRSVISDGVGNAFMVKAHGLAVLDIRYVPQVWAERGVLVAWCALTALFAALVAARLSRSRLSETWEETR